SEHDNDYAGLRRQWQRLLDLRASTSPTANEPVPFSTAELASSATCGTILRLPGASAELPLQAVVHSGDALLARVCVAVLLLGLTALVVYLRRHITLTFDVLPRLANPLGVIVGVAWWLWLAPSWFGWVIIVASVLLSLRSGLRTTTDAHSSIVRLPVATR
ncbi:MAG: hypothetical protein JNM18_02460, partial [Planctomycetaceae bacterium]|nr:hypothetical protein [Planctomycetaceae bacterium]